MSRKNHSCSDLAKPGRTSAPYYLKRIRVRKMTCVNPWSEEEAEGGLTLCYEIFRGQKTYFMRYGETWQKDVAEGDTVEVVVPQCGKCPFHEECGGEGDCGRWWINGHEGGCYTVGSDGKMHLWVEVCETSRSEALAQELARLLTEKGIPAHVEACEEVHVGSIAVCFRTPPFEPSGPTTYFVVKKTEKKSVVLVPSQKMTKDGLMRLTNQVIKILAMLSTEEEETMGSKKKVVDVIEQEDALDDANRVMKKLGVSFWYATTDFRRYYASCDLTEEEAMKLIRLAVKKEPYGDPDEAAAKLVLKRIN